MWCGQRRSVHIGAGAASRLTFQTTLPLDAPLRYFTVHSTCRMREQAHGGCKVQRSARSGASRCSAVQWYHCVVVSVGYGELGMGTPSSAALPLASGATGGVLLTIGHGGAWRIGASRSDSVRDVPLAWCVGAHRTDSVHDARPSGGIGALWSVPYRSHTGSILHKLYKLYKPARESGRLEGWRGVGGVGAGGPHRWRRRAEVSPRQSR